MKNRRDFIKNMGALGSLLLLDRFEGFALPPLRYPQHNIPVDKKLDPAWIRSLYKRDQPTLYHKTKNELRYIGMPAGGLHSGTLYMGGDGRLWLWGIYNDDREGVDPRDVLWNDGVNEVKVPPRNGANYVEPTTAANKRVLEQGFAIMLTYAGRTVIKELKEEDWDEVIFEAAYPQATVRYIDKNIPVEVVLKGGAFFIPLDADDSALPATTFNITITNTSAARVDIALAGWLENGANKITAQTGDGWRQNALAGVDGGRAIACSFKPGKPEAGTQRDAGTMAFAVMGSEGIINTAANPFPLTGAFFTKEQTALSETEAPGKLIGSIAVHDTLDPAGTFSASYVLAWHFSHPLKKLAQRMPESKEGYFYASRFKDASEVMAYVAKKFTALQAKTLLWQNTFYDSSLPHWFLERTFVNIGTIATANTYRFASGRFWGWEGVNSCAGTCTHVWQYAQALGRMFPSLERDTRQRVDLGVGMQQDGGILFRGEFESRPAIDGQAGTILRIYREHQLSRNGDWLKANWPAIKKAVAFMLAQDRNGDGMTDTPLENTLDAVWEGEIAWIVGLCIAAAKAAQLMAEEMKDHELAERCGSYVRKGGANMTEKLFNGEYFIHRPDAVNGRKKLGGYNSCHIDQVYGQSWAFQVGLGRLWDRERTLIALRSLWKYNFAPDVGPYVKTHTGGRPYALPGEAGMIMNTNPYNEQQPYGEDVTWQIGYFHECMSGFEHQVASHMMAEGMIDEALILTRAVHERYHGSKRNPYNEIECSDHYARAMASYGTFITACGFEYHGPKGYMRFAPRLSPDDFKAAFTAAEGWGSFMQKRSGTGLSATVQVKYGRLRLGSFGLVIPGDLPAKKVGVVYAGRSIAVRIDRSGVDILVRFEQDIMMDPSSSLQITVT